MRVRRFLSRWVFGALVVTLGPLSGCDWGGASAPKTADTSYEPPPESAQYITLILPDERSQVMDAYEQDAQVIAGLEQAIFRLEHPDPGTPASRQVELIEKAVADGTTAIVILPQDPKVVAPALVEAREKGVSVVVLNRPVEVEGTPLTLVTQPPIEKSLAPVVDEVRKGAKEFKLSPDGPAMIVVNRGPSESEAVARTEGLRKALKAAGVTEIYELEFQENKSQPDEFYRKALDHSPRPTMLFGIDDGSLSALARARAEDVAFNPTAPILGGMISQSRSLSLIEFNQAAAVVDMKVRPLVEEAIRIAIEQARGETVKSPVVIDRQLFVASNLHDPKPFSAPLRNEAKNPGPK